MAYTPKIDRHEDDGTQTPMTLIPTAELEALRARIEELREAFRLEAITAHDARVHRDYLLAHHNEVDKALARLSSYGYHSCQSCENVALPSKDPVCAECIEKSEGGLLSLKPLHFSPQQDRGPCGPCELSNGIGGCAADCEVGPDCKGPPREPPPSVTEIEGSWEDGSCPDGAWEDPSIMKQRRGE